MRFNNVSAFASVMMVSLFSSVSGAALDVFVPPITSPIAGDVWTSGQTQVITWDTSNAPADITNRLGYIRLRKNDLTTPLIVLAEKFGILAGHVQVTVPLVVEGSDYEIVLFGDSGNVSPSFTIKGSGVLF